MNAFSGSRMIRAADSASADLGLASWRVGRLTCWLVDPYGPRAMPMEFLTDAQVAGYGRFDGVPSRADLERFLFLDDADKDLLGDRRGDHNRLGLMLQATTVRYVGRFLEDPLDVPWPVVVPAGVRFSEMAQFSRTWPRPQGSGVS